MQPICNNKKLTVLLQCTCLFIHNSHISLHLWLMCLGQIIKSSSMKTCMFLLRMSSYWHVEITIVHLQLQCMCHDMLKMVSSLAFEFYIRAICTFTTFKLWSLCEMVTQMQCSSHRKCINKAPSPRCVLTSLTNRWNCRRQVLIVVILKHNTSGIVLKLYEHLADIPHLM